MDHANMLDDSPSQLPYSAYGDGVPFKNDPVLSDNDDMTDDELAIQFKGLTMTKVCDQAWVQYTCRLKFYAFVWVWGR